jgi:hypothetical protein
MQKSNFIDEMLSANSIEFKAVTLLVESTGTYLGLGIKINKDDPCFFFDYGENIVLISYSENLRVDERVHLIEIGL